MLTMPRQASPFRKLAQARVIREVKACLAREGEMGELYLAAWLETDGRGWLEMAGLGELAILPAEELARRAFRFGPEVLKKRRRCYYCWHLRGEGDRVACALGRWQDKEWRTMYARTTVRHGRKFTACEDFEEVGDGNDGDNGRGDDHAGGGDDGDSMGGRGRGDDQSG